MNGGLLLLVGSMLGLGLAANGAYMLASPADWYFAVPGVTTTGPFNQHFLRDIGLIFVLLGLLFVAGAVRPAWRAPFWGLGAIWLSGHALFHVCEVVAGICGAHALVRDFPAVSLPAMIAIMLTIWAATAPSGVGQRESDGAASGSGRRFQR